jgi:hypothetical protein
MEGSMRCALLVLAFGAATLQAGQAPAAATTPLMFTADLRGEYVAPAAVKTAASAKATAVLVGNRLTVHGSFAGLSSPLRDLEKTPKDPGVHLHRGAAGETSTYFHGLQVTLNPGGRSGIFFGTTILPDDLLKAFLASQSYVDIHTVKFGPGEVRDQWRPVDRAAAARLRAQMDGSPVSPSGVAGACH